jgi:hypothetical protein
VDTEMAIQGKTRQDVARLADLAPTTVDAVRHARSGTGADSIDAVVRALGMMVIADCIQAIDGGAADDYEAEAARLRDRESRDEHGAMVNMLSAKELLGMCRIYAELGLAAEAVRALNRWRAGLEQGEPQPQPEAPQPSVGKVGP